MGKYTSLARSLKEHVEGPQKAVLLRNTYVKINSKGYTRDRNTPAGEPSRVTPLRPTTLTTLIESEKDEKRNKVVCIHNMLPSACGLCNGYARWLIAGGDGVIARARRTPEAVLRAFWRDVKGRGEEA